MSEFSQFFNYPNFPLFNSKLILFRYFYDLKSIEKDQVNESNMNNIQSIHFNILEELNEQLRITTKNLSTTSEQLLQVISEKEKLIVDFSFIEQELKEEKDMRELDNKTEIIKLENFYREKTVEIELIVKGNEERMFLLSELHQTNLEAETERVRDGVIELEGERNKRRRVERDKKVFEAETHRLKTQLSVTSGGNASSDHIEEALKEIKSMQQQIDEKDAIILMLRSQESVDKKGSNERTNEAEGSNNGVKGGAVRPHRAKGGEALAVASRGSSALSGAMNGTYGGYLEQTEIADKRVEQLSREKRDLLSKNLEENKERLELSNRLHINEKEISQLKSNLTKMTLAKERMERKNANLMAGISTNGI
jgi:hypothetical protein